MANTFTNLMTNLLAGSIATLSGEMTAAKVIQKDTSSIATKKGETVSYNVPVAQSVSDITPAATPPAFTDTSTTDRQLTISNWKGSRFSLTERDVAKIQDAPDFIATQQGEAARAIAYAVNSSVWTKAHGATGAYGYAGTAGTTPFASDLTALTAVRKVLNRQKCPEGARHLILDYSAEEKLLNLSNISKVNERGSNEPLEKGQVGSLYGFKIWRDSQVPTHTSGTITTGLIAKASTAIAAGLKTFTAHTAASTGACALLAEDVIAINGHTTTYVLTADATQASANSDVTLTIEPGLEVALAGSETISVKASHTVNLALDEQAAILVLRPLKVEIAPGAPSIGETMIMQDKITGIPLRLDYYPGYHGGQFELSLCWGVDFIDPRRCARLAG